MDYDGPQPIYIRYNPNIHLTADQQIRCKAAEISGRLVGAMQIARKDGDPKFHVSPLQFARDIESYIRNDIKKD